MGKSGSGKGRRRRRGGREEPSIDFDAPLPFAVGTRVELPHLNESEGYSYGGVPNKPSSSQRQQQQQQQQQVGPHTGTVAGHWERRDHWPEHLRAPYLVLLDDGMAIYCHRTDVEFLRRSDVPPMEVSYGIGSRVECRLEAASPKWFPGTIVQRHEDWSSSPIDTPPYFVRFDYGRERPFWGPGDRIRAIDDAANGGNSKTKKKKNLPALRFDLGDRVVCSMDDDWMPGQIVRTWYREDDFENGHAVPYQVLLDSGEFIYAPMDDDDCIRKSLAPSVPLRFDVGDGVRCKVEGGWEPGMIASIDYHNEDVHSGRVVPYEIKLNNGDYVYAPCDNDLFIRKQLRFKEGDRVDCYLYEDDEWMPGTVTETDLEDELEDFHVVPYRVKLDMGDSILATADDDKCIKKSTIPFVCRGERNGFDYVMSKMLILNEEYEDAEDMLLERIALIKSNIENNPDKKDVAHLKVDLSNFLCHLAEAYQAMGYLEEMKEALDEALDLINVARDKSRCHRLLNVTSKLATHAALTNDKYAALAYSEEAILLAQKTTGGHDSFRLGLMLFQCGKLNVGCDGRRRGLTQMSEGLKILTRLYGSNNERVKSAKKELREILYQQTADGGDCV